MSSSGIACWHFVRNDVAGRPVMRDGSIRALDALHYAPGLTICRVRIGGDIQHESDKICGRWREVLAMADVTVAVVQFAADVAERALLAERAAGREPAQASWDAVALVRTYGTPEFPGRESANAAANAAADAATYAAACADADAADAADAAVRAVVRAAAAAAADAAAYAAHNEMLEARLYVLAPQEMPMPE